MPVRKKTKYALLGILKISPMSGYDLKKFCDEVVSHFWNENYAHIYPVLKEMEIEGLAIKSPMKTEGRPLKNVYTVTEKGRNELEKWLLEPVEPYRTRDEFSLKFFFSTDVPIDKLIEKIEVRKEEFEKLLAHYIQFEKERDTYNNKEDEKIVIISTILLNAGKHQCKAMIDWCNETLETLEKIK